MPTVARHSARTIRTSMEGRRRLTIGPSLATTWIAVPAARPRRPPCPGTSSTLWTTVPVGIARSGSALPGRMSAPWRRTRPRRPDREPLRGEDVALLAVGVVQQGDVAAAVGVVLDRRDLGRDAVLAALEVDPAVAALGAAAAMAAGDAARTSCARRDFAPSVSGLSGSVVGDLLAQRVGREAAARGWSALSCGSPSVDSLLRDRRALEQLDPLARRELDDRLLPGRVLPRWMPRRFGFARTFAVRTAATRTPKISSTACAIWVLWARSWTRNVYLPSAISA